MEEEIGEVIHFFKRISVAAVRIYPGKSLKVGDRIAIRGPHTNIEQVVESLQIQHKNVLEASGGAEVGLLVPLGPEEEAPIPNIPRAGNKVYKLLD